MKIPSIALNDEWLAPFSGLIIELQEKAQEREKELSKNSGTIIDFANGHLFFGQHIENNNLVIREWAPAATSIWLIGDFSDWKKKPEFQFKEIASGVWEFVTKSTNIPHGTLYKLIIAWNGGEGERIPAWATRAVQDDTTKIFSAQIWTPKPYEWKNKIPPKPKFPLIYESHTGMSGEEGKVTTFNEFRKDRLPYIKKLGYNTIQLMAIQEHPYYGSFGYHVSSFFAVSSRFGTPEELKQLIDDAHGMGIRVIMDIVHSHAVKNESEGISRFDGSGYQFFHDGPRGDHAAWDSKCFNYAKPEVLHFLLSNCKYWLDEYHFDGFRFDGITSMLYLDHGLGKSFMSYADYFSENTDTDALVYLILANKLIHTLRPDAICIAEDMSGYPGIASAQKAGGIGFDYRLAMGIPDYWIKIIKEQKDENWQVGDIFYQLTNKRYDEKVISYAESHDQALVGDKTIIFRLMDADMYFHMDCSQRNLNIDRGMALHKIIRLLTLTTAGGGYLNFMGNEFGHPEWIDFPRQGNNWSYHYARRQWSLATNKDLRYKSLLEFDRAMIALVKKEKLLKKPAKAIIQNNDDQILVFERGNCLVVVNLNPAKSFTGYGIPVNHPHWKITLNSDDTQFDGFGRIDNSICYEALQEEVLRLKLYLP
ncbi:MAG: 1,4-alpha-glucan-branching enzyme, partial [Bacteroidetes bacterium HGW-Bacteroidetes-21]